MLVYLAIALGVILFLTGSPIFVAFGIGASIACLWYLGLPPIIIASRLFDTINSFVLLAVPLFILAGFLMAQGGSGERTFEFANTLLRHIKGGLGAVVILASTLVAAMTGSGPATAAAVGTIAVPSMTERGYTRQASTACVAAGATLGPIIPPSVWFILYGMLTATSVVELFLAGVIPGLLIAFAFIPVARFQARRFPLLPPATWRERRSSFFKSVPALLMPVFVLGGIYGGVFSPTEAAAMGAVYAAIIGVAVYRKLNPRSLLTALSDAAFTTSAVFMILVAAMLLAFLIAQLGFPALIQKAILPLGLGPTGFLYATTAVVLLLGMFIEGLPVLLLVIPVLWPTVLALGIDTVHFGLVVTVGLCIGQISPPYGITVFAISSFTGEPAMSIFRGAIPYIITEIAVLYILITFPQIALVLPQLIY